MMKINIYNHITKYMYNASRKYSHPIPFPTFCYVTVLFQNVSNSFVFLINIHTIPHNDKANVFLENSAMY